MYILLHLYGAINVERTETIQGSISRLQNHDTHGVLAAVRG